MLLEDRGRPHVGHRPFEDLVHGLRLALIGHGEDHHVARQDAPDRHRDRFGRHIVEGGEPALAELLAAAALIQRDNLVGHRRVEVSRRIVEGEMAVLADAGEHHVDRMGIEHGVDTLDLTLEVRRVALDEVESAELRKAPGEALLQIAPEARRMRIGHGDILVEMKGSDTRPVDFVVLDKAFKHLELAGAGGDDDIRRAVRNDSVDNGLCAEGSGGRAGLGLGCVEPDVDHEDVLSRGMMWRGLDLDAPDCKAGPVDPRRTSSALSTAGTAEGDEPECVSSKRSTAAAPAWAQCALTVVSGGVVVAAMTSSQPTRLKSPGTERPRSASPAIMPCATMSSTAKAAVAPASRTSATEPRPAA